eukprot:2102240-Amphidinium_carterae.1
MSYVQDCTHVDSIAVASLDKALVHNVTTLAKGRGQGTYCMAREFHGCWDRYLATRNLAGNSTDKIIVFGKSTDKTIVFQGLHQLELMSRSMSVVLRGSADGIDI